MKRLLVAGVACLTACAAFALDKVVIVPAHPDDLIACLGFAHLARGVFELHVIDYTHGERGCGEEKFKTVMGGEKVE